MFCYHCLLEGLKMASVALTIVTVPMVVTIVGMIGSGVRFVRDWHRLG